MRGGLWSNRWVPDSTPLTSLTELLTDPLVFTAILLIVAAISVVLLVLFIGARRHTHAARETMVAQGIRLDEQSRQSEVRGQRVEDTVRAIEQRGRDDAERTRQMLDARLSELREQLLGTLGEHQTRFEKRHAEAAHSAREQLDNTLQGVRKQLLDALERKSEDLEKRVNGLTKATDDRLKEISGQVDKRLNEGFEKTNQTFVDIQKRLALIDKAQVEITKLSTNVVSLQEVLSDKRSRGAFGEMQLNALVRNVMPESTFQLQHTLSNDKIADCVLFLPQPTGSIAIDAKFPKESYDRMTDVTLGDADRREAERQFKVDIRKHVHDISGKYILPGETADGAVMFIPAEAIFAEIHAHHTDLVEEAYRARVWLVSPTTLMAILNTARAVLKDEETRKQIHVIQEHLRVLARDFDRFQTRMDNLSKHIGQANDDVKQINTSAKKISSRFGKIEKVELNADEIDGSVEQVNILTTSDD